MPLYEYKCSLCHEVIEEIRSLQDRMNPATCKVCKAEALFVISTPTIKLEGITGHFPTAADKWAKARIEGTKIARKREND